MEEQFVNKNFRGDKFYHKDKELTIIHREDGPAVERLNGDKHWYIDNLLHRVDGPAKEYANGDKYWYVNGRLHRIDGPAIELKNGSDSWWINDNELTEDQLNEKLKEMYKKKGRGIRTVR